MVNIFSPRNPESAFFWKKKKIYQKYICIFFPLNYNTIQPLSYNNLLNVVIRLYIICNYMQRIRPLLSEINADIHRKY